MKDLFLKNLVPPLAVLIIGVGAFFMGSLWQQLQIVRGGGIVGTGNAAVPTNNAPSAVTVTGEVELTDTDHIRGNPDAKIAFIEYSDYECPFCKNFHPTAQQVVDAYGDDVMWVFRHFPLTQIHPGAQKKAEAAECVASLGGNDAFWEFTDVIFENQNVPVSGLSGLAGDIGINTADFEECLESGEMESVVTAQSQSGLEAGVRGTPGTILLNTETGEKELISGALPFDQVKTAIDGMLN